MPLHCVVMFAIVFLSIYLLNPSNFKFFVIQFHALTKSPKHINHLFSLIGLMLTLTGNLYLCVKKRKIGIYHFNVSLMNDKKKNFWSIVINTLIMVLNGLLTYIN